MKKNVGTPDKIVRYVIAIIAIWLAYSGRVANPWNFILYVVAAIMIVTAFVGTCPIWLATGLNTLKKKEN